MQTQMQTKTKQHTRHTNRNARIVFMAMAAMLLLPLASCINDNYDEEPAATTGTISVGLSIQTRSIGDITSDSKTYVEGTEWENYIDITGGDFRIYFFTNNATEQKDNTLIAEFTPTDIYPEEGSDYTIYTLIGKVGEDVAAYSNFKVVVLANWGVNNYPSVIPGTTTIDDICNASTAVFSAFVDTSGNALMPSSELHIPFFGIHEYSGVEWIEGRRTTLDGAITLLRAVAKVEVILDNDYEDEVTFEDVEVVGYNSQGYCAPTGVYLQSDYDHNYTWNLDFVDDLHLWNNANDSGATSNRMEMSRLQLTSADNSQKETWACYLTEYRNTTTDGSTTTAASDYSYIELKVGGDEYQIYFANYSEGVTSSMADYDIYRNYLYRFHVTVSNLTVYVYVEPWTLLDEEVVDL